MTSKRKSSKVCFDARFSDTVPILKILANKQRIHILWSLVGSRSDIPVATLALETDLTRSALSQHLAILRKHGIVVARRAGRNFFYRLADSDAAHTAITFLGKIVG